MSLSTIVMSCGPLANFPYINQYGLYRLRLPNGVFNTFRRRNKRRMETPAAPHPELTPQQKQHIFERTSTPGNLQPGAPTRRILPGGSVAERVLMFEKSPFVFGPPENKETKLSAQRKEAPVINNTTGASAVITPWKSKFIEANNKSQVRF